jgi:hypothetical protein
MNTNQQHSDNERKYALENYFKSLKKLEELGICQNRRDFTSQLGEWLICELYNGKLAQNGKNPDWDMTVGTQKIQVKAHSKAKTTKREDTDFLYDESSDIDRFVIVVFNIDYKIKNIYNLPMKVALDLKSRDTKTPVIRWSQIPKEYTVDFGKIIGNNELLSMFLNK